MPSFFEQFISSVAKEAKQMTQIERTTTFCFWEHTKFPEQTQLQAASALSVI